jgi:hypothetical protein
LRANAAAADFDPSPPPTLIPGPQQPQPFGLQLHQGPVEVGQLGVERRVGHGVEVLAPVGVDHRRDPGDGGLSGHAPHPNRHEHTFATPNRIKPPVDVRPRALVWDATLDLDDLAVGHP